MPLARIDLIKGKPPSHRRTIGDVVYHAMVDVLKAPVDDRFQVIAEHDAGDLIYPSRFMDMERSADIVIIQLTLVGGHTVEQKRAFYKRVADDLHEQLKLRREDVFVTLVGTGRDDWSFGGGVASLDPDA